MKTALQTEKKKILIVEDEAITALNIKNILIKKGYEIYGISSTADDAYNLTESLNPDLILIDIILSGEKDGITAVNKIKEKYDIPIVYLTAHSNEMTLQRAKKTEPHGYILKPINHQELLTTVEIAIYKHLMEKKLKISEKRYRTLLNNLPLGVFRTTPDNRFISVNPAMVRMFGYNSEEEMIKIKPSTLYADPHERSVIVKRILKDNELKRAEVSIRRKNGTTLEIMIDALLNVNESGQHFIDGIITDITDRKKAELELKVSEAKFRGITEKSLVGVYLVQDGICKYINPRFAEIFGYSVDEIIDKLGPGELTHEEDIHIVERNIKRRVNGELNSMNYSFRGKKKTSEIINVEVYGSKTIYNGKPAVIGTLLDITERKKAEYKVMASLKEKETLLQEIHHRVKNNMQVITSLLSLQSNQVDDMELHRLLNESENRIRSMALVHEKLYQSDDLSHIDLEKYVPELVDELYQSYNKSKEFITINIKAKEILLGIDKAIPCGLILNELVTNALKHAFPKERKGEININIQYDKNDNYIISVKDNGTGFQPGVDISNPETLGLQLVDALVRQIHGEFKIIDKNGTEIIITFPVEKS